MTTNAENPTPKPEIDIFQELREKKLKQSDVKVACPTTVPVAPESKDPRSRNKFAGLLGAAVVGALIGVVGATSGIGAKRELSKNDVAGDESALAIPLLIPNHEDAAPPLESKRAAALIKSLEVKYHAVRWSSGIREVRRTNPFSIEIDDALIRADARPIVVRCTILDIAYGENNIVTKFGIRDAGGHFKNVLVLKTEKEKLRIFASALRGVTEYAVVAKCNSSENNSEGDHFVMGSLVEAVNLPGN